MEIVINLFDLILVVHFVEYDISTNVFDNIFENIDY